MARPKKARPTSVTVYEGSDGRWHGYLTVGIRPDGRPERRQRTAKTRDECEQKIRVLEDQLANDAVPKAGRPPTMESWLTHWVENIARPSVSYKTYTNSYAYAVYRFLIPGLGAHRLDRLEPEHLEALYQKLLGTEKAPGLSGGTVALIHRTARVALNEAVRRDKLAKNPCLVARAPESEADEVNPLTKDESRRLLDTIAHRRNGVRWSFAMLGLRQGEVLGLRWSDVDLVNGMLTIRGQAQRRKWQHGCDDQVTCAKWRHGCRNRDECHPLAVKCPKREVRCRLKPCGPAWEHGCPDRALCEAKQARACRQRVAAHCPRHRADCPPPCTDRCVEHAASCPKRTGGGVVIDDGAEKEARRKHSRRRLRTKSKAGTRRLALPEPLLVDLRAHRQRQVQERLHAGSLWKERDLVIASVIGSPVDARRDWQEWKELLVEADVRNVTVHTARHTAATMLLLKGVDRRVVMDVMGWSSERMLGRYQHVADEMRQEAAKRLGEVYWEPGSGAASATDHATIPRQKKTAPNQGQRKPRLNAV